MVSIVFGDCGRRSGCFVSFHSQRLLQKGHLRLRAFLGLLTIASLFLSAQGMAWQAAVSPSYRLYPMTGDFAASLKQEGLLYDKRTESDSLSYGLWQLKASASITGTLEASASLYPVSFARVTVAVGGVDRYYNVPTFNCTYVNCQGFVSKNRLGFGFVIATGEMKQWIVLPEYNLYQVSSSQTNLPIGDETELILANPTGDTLDQYSVIFAKKMETKLYGLLVRQAQYRSSGQHNEMQALINKTIWRDTSFLIGVGRYASDMNVPGITAFASYEWRWGYSQALF
jgi:hypothetical protein